MLLKDGLQIIVCIKQVPDISEIKLDPITHTLVREGVPSIVNPWDDLGIELAIELKEKYGGKICVITMGPPQASESLKRCLALGCDQAILLSDKSLAGADTIATAYTLSVLIKKLPFDIIICGRQAVDAETGHVGPQIAEMLNIPQICYVQKIDLDVQKSTVIAHKESDYGIEIIEAFLPVLLTTSKGLNELRNPTLRGIINSRKREITIMKSIDLDGDPNRFGFKGSPTFVTKVKPPPVHPPEALFKGEPKNAVEQLLKVLKEKKVPPLCL